MAKLIDSHFSLAFNVSTGLNTKISIGREYRLQGLKRISKAIVLFEKQMSMYDMEAYYGITVHNFRMITLTCFLAITACLPNVTLITK